MIIDEVLFVDMILGIMVCKFGVMIGCICGFIKDVEFVVNWNGEVGIYV